MPRSPPPAAAGAFGPAAAAAAGSDAKKPQRPAAPARLPGPSAVHAHVGCGGCRSRRRRVVSAPDGRE
eukprot:scaffold7773_cov110-Isochrysis_galbana.AAC.5